MPHRSRLLFGTIVVALAGTLLFAQAPAAPAGGPPVGPAAGRGGGGRAGGLPGASPEQNQAVVEMNAALTAQLAIATAARVELGTVALANSLNAAAIRAAAEKLAAAELVVASARAEAFARVQAGPNRLTAEQVAVLVASGGNMPGGRGAAVAAPARGRAN